MKAATTRPGWGEPVRVDVVTHGPEHVPEVVAFVRDSIVSLLGLKWRGAGGHTMWSGDHRLDLIDVQDKANLTLRLNHAKQGIVWIMETPRPDGIRPPDPDTCLRHALMMIDACAVETPRDAVRAWILAIASMLSEYGIPVRTIRLNGPYGGFWITERRIDENGRPRLRRCDHPLTRHFSEATPTGLTISSYAGGEGGDCTRIIVSQEGGVVTPGSANHPDTDLLETMRALAFVAPHLKDVR